MKTASFALALGLALLGSDNARATCWTAMCLNYSPLYDQTSTTIPSGWFPSGDPSSSLLCAPTSASMSLQGLVADLADNSVLTRGWTQGSFAGRAMADQIVAMAVKMNTGVTTGTKQAASVGTFAGAAGDLVFHLPFLDLPIGNSNTLYVNDITLGAFKDKFRSEEVRLITSYGHYNEYKEYINTPTLRQMTITYKRNGGHVIALRGFIADSLFINDPYAVVYVSPIQTLAARNESVTRNGVTDRKVVTLPNGAAQASVVQYKQSGGYYPIMEAATTLGAPFAD